jgi:hypothetical protein
MQLSTLLWLGLLVLLGAFFVVTLRRMSMLAARTRNLERFQRGTGSLDGRFGAVVVPLVHSLDETRRHAGDPEQLRRQVTEAQVTLAELLAETRSLAAPGGLASAVAAMAGELERASRAASLVEHGLDSMVNSSRGRDLEAQTSLKRGALNLRHSHEAFARVARDVAALQPTTPGSAAAAALSTYPTTDTDDVEGRFDPRM